MRLLRSVILEGMDGAGKSALYETMTEKWGLRGSGHDGGPPVNAADVWERLAMFAAQSPTVRDRCPAVSDVVYSRVLGRGTKVPEERTRAWLRYFRPFVIYCRPPLATVMAHTVQVKPHKTSEFVAEIQDRRESLYDTYDQVLAEHADADLIDGFQYDWTIDSTARALRDHLIVAGVLCAD
jgi:shikimate kinase